MDLSKGNTSEYDTIVDTDPGKMCVSRNDPEPETYVNLIIQQTNLKKENLVKDGQLTCKRRNVCFGTIIAALSVLLLVAVSYITFLYLSNEMGRKVCKTTNARTLSTATPGILWCCELETDHTDTDEYLDRMNEPTLTATSSLDKPTTTPRSLELDFYINDDVINDKLSPVDCKPCTAEYGYVNAIESVGGHAEDNGEDHEHDNYSDDDEYSGDSEYSDDGEYIGDSEYSGDGGSNVFPRL